MSEKLSTSCWKSDHNRLDNHLSLENSCTAQLTQRCRFEMSKIEIVDCLVKLFSCTRGNGGVFRKYVWHIFCPTRTLICFTQVNIIYCTVDCGQQKHYYVTAKIRYLRYIFHIHMIFGLYHQFLDGLWRFIPLKNNLRY